MSSISASLFSLPWVQFKKHPTFYLWYDSVYMVACLCLLFTLWETSYTSPIQELHWWYLPVLVPVCYAQILCSVFIHNAVHGNFPRAINRIVGELCGIVVLTRFASWEIVHRRHHRYSDDPEKDPHPLKKSYWRYFFFTIANVEKQLQQQYFELYGENEQTRSYERWRARLSYVTNLLLVLCWFTLLGPVGFFVFFVPASVIGALHLVHFNWSTHNALAEGEDFKPVNLDEGYFWWGNRLFFGIYMHDNHHRMARLFNPAKLDQVLAKRRAERQAREDGQGDGQGLVAVGEAAE